MQYFMAWFVVFWILLVQIVLGVYLFNFTPKKDSKFGFRTKTSTSSATRWDFANKWLGFIYVCEVVLEIIVFGVVLGTSLTSAYLAASLSSIYVSLVIFLATPFVINYLTTKTE